MDLTVRQKEFSSRELYAKRNALTAAIPSFWSEILTSGAVPAELGAVFTPLDVTVLESVKSLNVERYQIKSDTEGEPRSLRFTFEFAPNKFFSDTKIIKDFEYIAFGGGPGGYVSKPVNFKWTKDAKKAGVNKLLDLAEQLYQAEQALGHDGPVDQQERESLWQYEKLRKALEQVENEEVEEDGHSFLEWFGYRGAVNTAPKPKPANGEANGDAEDDEDDEEEEEDGVLDVEIFPAGEDVAVAIAEDLWPNVMDYFIQATTDGVEEESDDDDDNAPELIEADDFEGFEETDSRPAKKRKTTS